MKQARCSSCGAAIIFVQTATGKSMPLNAEPDAAGNVTLEEAGVAGGKMARIHGAEALAGLNASVPRYQSHLTACQHRRPK